MKTTTATKKGWFRRFRESDVVYDFKRSPVTIGATILLALSVGCAILAPLITTHNPFDLASFSLSDSLIPPSWMAGSDPTFVLGTDNQGRDLLSAILYGLRISLSVGFSSVALAACLGVTLGLISGYFRGRVEALIMRIAEIQQTFPAILIAILLGGVFRALVPKVNQATTGHWVVVLAIGMAFWVQYARSVRALTLVESGKDYVLAARLIGRKPTAILFHHILINVMGPVLVIATINLALAIITEATLSFLGIGVPVTEPSLGTLIRIGNDFLFSGEWWIAFFPGLMLALLSLSINLVGDWLRDVLNPRMR